MEKTLVLFFNNGQVYLAPGCGIGMDRTNIPHTYQPFRQGIYWTVSILKTSSINGNLITKVKDYCGSPESFSIQKAPSEIPPGIIINEISTSKLFEAWVDILPALKRPGFLRRGAWCVVGSEGSCCWRPWCAAHFTGDPGESRP